MFQSRVNNHDNSLLVIFQNQNTRSKILCLFKTYCIVWASTLFSEKSAEVSGIMQYVHSMNTGWCSFKYKYRYAKWCTKESPRAHVARFYGRLWLICRVLRVSKFAVLKLIEIVILWVYYSCLLSPFGLEVSIHILHRSLSFSFALKFEHLWKRVLTNIV